MEGVSTPSYFVGAIIKNLPDGQLNRLKLLRKYNIPPSLPEQRDARLSADQFWRLQQQVTHLLQDEMVGYLNGPLPPGTFALACQSLILSTTVGEAMRRYCRFYQLADKGLVPELHTDSSFARVRLRITDNDFEFDIYAFESSLYYIHRLINWLASGHVQPRRVDLAYPEPEHAAVYRPLFFGSPVYFERRQTELVFDAAVMDLPVLQTPETLNRFLPKAIYEMLIQYYESMLWSGQVRKLITAQIERVPELNEIADQLSLHPQTLRRRLKAEGTSFQKLKNVSRRDYAVYRLARSNDSIEAIAEKIGFSESSTFIRAFKGWTGMTPLTYRNVE